MGSITYEKSLFLFTLPLFCCFLSSCIYNNKKVSKLFILDKEVKQFTLDPFQETADINLENNFYPKKELPSKFQLFKEKARQKEKNLMQLNEMQQRK